MTRKTKGVSILIDIGIDDRKTCKFERASILRMVKFLLPFDFEKLNHIQICLYKFHKKLIHLILQ